MNQVNSEGKYQPSATLPCIPTPVYQQQSSRNQCYGFIQSPVKYLPERTPQPPPGSHQYYGESMSCTQQYCMPQLPVGYSLDGRVRYRDTLARPQKNDRPTTLPGAAGDLTACQLQHPNSSLPQGVTGDSAHCSQQPAEEGLQKRELRLMKNREAARECRRKKKDYVKCLENRVVVLENQNKTLIEELKTLKDIYRHKVEEAARECRKRKKEYMDHLQTRNTLLETENEQLRAQVKHLYNHNH